MPRVIDERLTRAIESFVSEHADQLERDVRETNSHEMATIEKELAQAGFHVESRLTVGNPLREILREVVTCQVIDICILFPRRRFVSIPIVLQSPIDHPRLVD
jgi:hypothetical protein